MCSLNFKKPSKWEPIGPNSYYDDSLDDLKIDDHLSNNIKKNQGCEEFFEYLEGRIGPQVQAYSDYFSDYGDTAYNSGETGFLVLFQIYI